MALLWLADVLRAAGLTVIEHTDWKTHYRSGDWSPKYGVVHATAAPASQADSVQVRVVRDGRSDLPGPIANAVIDRQGRWHVVSAGRCNSTLVGTAGPFEGLGNTYALSTEACNDNVSEPWPDVQYRAYVRGWAAWCKRLGWDPAHLVGHKEHTPGRKTDPTFNMDRFRADVAAVLAGKGDDMSAQAENEIHQVYAGMFNGGSSMGRAVDPDGAGPGKASNSLVAKVDYALTRLDQVAAQVAKLSAPAPVVVDSATLSAALANPTLLAALARAVNDDAARRLAG